MTHQTAENHLKVFCLPGSKSQQLQFGHRLQRAVTSIVQALHEQFTWHLNTAMVRKKMTARSIQFCLTILCYGHHEIYIVAL